VIEQRIEELGVRDHVGLYGVSNDLPPLYRELDAFVLSSVAEGTSMSILEAMSSGVAVVATRVGGNADVLADTGVLVPTEDPAALAGALERLVASQQERDALGRAARLRVQTHYDEEIVTDRYLALYRGMPLDAFTPGLAAETCAE
jgi:glycosyltransferase involved in cell wall biosynthesis